MSGQWYQSSNASLERATSTLTGVWQTLAQPARAQRLRQIVVFLLLIWVILALADLLWAFLPRPGATLPEASSVLNPVESRSGGPAVEPVDVENMVSWHLFGEAGEAAPGAVPTPEATVSDREGIENGARETRLDLILRGVVSASEDGLGHAIIEHRSQQEVYAVEDKLPTGSKVTLAKVLPGSVVLDNNGTYELLQLFEDNALLGQLPPSGTRQKPAAAAKPEPSAEARGGGEDATAVARSLRQQLYENPQSLGEVVRVSAVRENNTLRGYRVDPGRNGAQFSQLGFEAGDVVTSVNGVSLDNPGNTMQLYQLMRTSTEAVFDVQRGGQSLTLTVSLDESHNGG